MLFRSVQGIICRKTSNLERPMKIGLLAVHLAVLLGAIIPAACFGQAGAERSITLHVVADPASVQAAELASGAVEGKSVTLPDGRQAFWVKCHREVSPDERSDVISSNDLVLVLVGAGDPELFVESARLSTDGGGNPIWFLTIRKADSSRLHEFTERNVGRTAVVVHRQEVVQIAKICAPISQGITAMAFGDKAASDMEPPSQDTRQIDIADVAKAMLLISLTVDRKSVV